MNLSDERTKKSQPTGVSKTEVLLMVMTVICLAILAVFANVQHSRRSAIEAVTVKSTALPATKER